MITTKDLRYLPEVFCFGDISYERKNYTLGI